MIQNISTQLQFPLSPLHLLKNSARRRFFVMYKGFYHASTKTAKLIFIRNLKNRRTPINTRGRRVMGESESE